MKSLVIMAIISIALVMMPVMAVAQSAQTAAATPPLSQPLVREGTFATKLADALKVGPATNEADAESSLSAVGIAPRNGWIADYPVTPDIAVEIQTSITDAAAAGRIPETKDAAAKAFQDVLASYSLSVAPGISSPAANEAYAPEYPESDVVNDYYYDEGPPVVTYYAPPPDYAYLYSWVPYPFWWSDFWFPGFFVLADFDLDIGFHGHDGHGHHHGHGDRDDFVSNHFRDSSTGRMSRIDPANRIHGGIFAERGGARGWASPSARSSAQSIVTNSRAFASVRNNNIGTRTGVSRLPSRSITSGSVARTTTPGIRTYGSSSFGTPSARWHADRTPRTFVPSYGQGRTFSQPAYRPQGNLRPSMGSRSFTAPSYRTNGNFSSSMGSRSFTAPSGGFRSFSSPSYGGRSSGGSFGGMRGSFSGGGRGGGFRR